MAIDSGLPSGVANSAWIVDCSCVLLPCAMARSCMGLNELVQAVAAAGNAACGQRQELCVWCGAGGRQSVGDAWRFVPSAVFAWGMTEHWSIQCKCVVALPLTLSRRSLDNACRVSFVWECWC